MLKLSQAETIATEALKLARQKNFNPLAIVILNAEGNPVLLKREDGATFFRVSIANAKAWGSLAMGCGSRELTQRAEKNAPFFGSLTALANGQMIPVAGGVLIKDSDGQVIGAVGISGDVAGNDELCAVQGITSASLQADTGEKS